MSAFRNVLLSLLGVIFSTSLMAQGNNFDDFEDFDEFNQFDDQQNELENDFSQFNLDQELNELDDFEDDEFDDFFDNNSDFFNDNSDDEKRVKKNPVRTELQAVDPNKILTALENGEAYKQYYLTYLGGRPEGVGYLIGKDITVYDSPSLDANVTQVIGESKNVHIVQSLGDWYQIGKNEWVEKRFIQNAGLKTQGLNIDSFSPREDVFEQKVEVSSEPIEEMKNQEFNQQQVENQENFNQQNQNLNQNLDQNLNQNLIQENEGDFEQNGDENFEDQNNENDF